MPRSVVAGPPSYGRVTPVHPCGMTMSRRRRPSLAGMRFRVRRREGGDPTPPPVAQESPSRWGVATRTTWRGTKATGRGVAYAARAIGPAIRFVVRHPYVVLYPVAAILFVVDASTMTAQFAVSVVLVLPLAAIDVAPLLLVRYWPFGAWLAATVVALGWAATATPLAGSGLPWTVCQHLVQLLLLALVAMLGRTVEVVVAAVAGSVVTLVLLPGDLKAWTVANGLVILLGLLLRWLVISRRELAAQSRATRQERDLRAVIEERSRIARELHDVVAHHMSMVVVQAQSAPARLGDLPPQVAAEFAAIEGSARQALTEVRGVLGVLREDRRGVELAPQPGLAEVPDLLEASRVAGVDVVWRLDLAAERWPPSTALMLHRVLQEALANAVRHAPGSHVEVSLAIVGDTAVLSVRNGPGTRKQAGVDAPVGSDAGGGNGLPGMRARAEAVGGTLVADATPEGGFLVEAHVPLTGRPGGAPHEATA